MMAPAINMNFIPNICGGPCSYCKMTNNLTPEEFLNCDKCGEVVHISCLRLGLPYERLLGDNFFHYTCEHCSSDKTEIIKRPDVPLLYSVLLAIYNLHQNHENESEDGYFHYKKHVHSFLLNNWKLLYDSDGRRPSLSCVSGLLSRTNYFVPRKAGRGRVGWYKLVENKAPTYLIHTYGLKKSPSSIEQNGNAVKKLKISEAASPNLILPTTMLIKEEIMDDSESLDDNSSRGSWFTDRDIIKPGIKPPTSIFEDDCDVNVEIKEEESLDEGLLALDKYPLEKVSNDVSQNVRPSLFSKSTPPVKEERDISFHHFNDNLRLLSNFEEGKLLNQLEVLYKTSSLSSKLYRLRRKLKTRKLKREHGLLIFNIDEEINFINSNGRLMSYEDRKMMQLANEHTTSFKDQSSRILDRFQIPERGVTVKKEFTTFKIKLVGDSADSFDYVYSPYTLRNLKPYIYRDYTSKPLKLRLLEEIRANGKTKDPNWDKLSEKVPIDYCYVTHKHIPAMNQLARQFFWPGIELSEVLRYPDYTCVVLYKKLVIGFGIVVPDTTYNEAYISFLLVHPEWRRAGIAKLILYHLIQTCPGKDIILHVSATNPALIMYQQFGFKVEEFLTDFYDKYFEADSQECKHAMFMRLRR